jgi:hypothetical protein
MKTFATACLLSACVFLTAGDSADAQLSINRRFQRVVASEVFGTPGHRIVTSPVVTYGGFSHIDELAVEMEQRARDILWEMHFHYRHNRDFDVTYSEAYSMLNQAKFIHQAEHRGDRAAISRAVTELDHLFHHIEDDIRSWRTSHRHFSSRGSLSDKMEAMELTLHHLMEDVGIEVSTTDPPPPGGFGNPPAPSLRLP